MRRLILAALGVLAIASAASAQQPLPPAPQPQPAQPAVPSPAAVAAPPAQPAPATTVIRGNSGCSSCGSKIQSVTGGNCLYAYGCQNGCGSLKSDLAFTFGSCKDFFSPCGPTCGSMFGNGLFGSKCPKLQFAQPYGTGWQCPRQYDTYTNH
jgi:hypothetical protein